MNEHNMVGVLYCIYIFHTQYTCSKDRESASAAGKESVALRTQLRLHFQQRAGENGSFHQWLV
jgi:hypothetical protein